MGWCKFLAVAVAGAACGLLVAAELAAQPPARGLGGSLAGSFELLLREEVRSELELSGEQVAELRKLRDAQAARFRELVAQTGGASPEERLEQMRTLAAQTQQQVEQILLPHQRKRLEQLSNQLRLRGGAGTLFPERLADELGLSDAQKQRLRSRAEQLEAELRQKLAELRKQAQDELLQELTPEQRAQWKEMIGEPFEFRFERASPGGLGGGRPGLPDGASTQRGVPGGRRGV